MTPIAFFDANCQLGRFNFRLPGVPYALKDLLDDTREQGMARRLVYHAMAKEYNPATGNHRLMGELAGHPELVPCWGLGAWVTGEMPPPQELLAEMKAQGVRAVRFFVHSYVIPWADWSLGPLWARLEAHRVPLFLDLGGRWAEMDPFDTQPVYDLCHGHPGLPVILVKHRIRFNRQVYALFEACPNVRVELSGYWHYRGVEDICLRFGPERLLFGTNWPHMDSSFAAAAVMYAEVPEEAKAAVAGGNLTGLLEGVRW